MIRRRFLQRPEGFRLDPTAGLARGLVFAGLGGGRGSVTMRDSSLRNNHGTLTAMDPADDWIWSAELGRWVTRYDGATNYGTVPYSPSFGLLTSLTTVFWVRTHTGYEKIDLDTVFSRAVATSPTEVPWRWYFSGAGLPLRWSFFSGGDRAIEDSGGIASTTNTWFCYVGTAVDTGGSTTLSLYRDGKLIGSATFSVSLPQRTTDLFLGAENNRRFVPCDIADSLIFSRALTPSEIQQLADPSNVMLSGLVLPPRRRLWAVGSAVTPLSLTGASVQLESPYAVDDAVATAEATGGTPGYTYTITSQVKA